MPSKQGLPSIRAGLSADALRNLFPFSSEFDPVFKKVLLYVLGNPGSLIRSQLAFAVAVEYGVEVERAEKLAVALEYFHTASLLFDDMPCMDNAQKRRGVTCAHLQFGEENAILAALALINRAYALVWQSVAGCPPGTQPQVLDYIERCLGAEGLLNGQSLDLHYSALPRSKETTQAIARQKTAALIRMTLVLPAMLGGARISEIQWMERISVFWGLGYQILDDLKDRLQDATQTGKTAARDGQLGRPNLVEIIGVEGAIMRFTRLMDLGNTALRRLLALRPGLEFMQQLGEQLEDELDRVACNDCPPVGATAA